MPYPHIIDLQSLNKAKDNRTLGIPDANEAIKAALNIFCNILEDIQRGYHLGDRSDIVKAALRAAFVSLAVDPPPTPSVVPPESDNS
jgi:hypothetical protein